MRLPFILVLFTGLFIACQPVAKKQEKIATKHLKLNLQEANRLATLPLECIEQEYPNKLGQVLTSNHDLQTPRELHPVFYGCFDWHSAVHGHWSLVKLLKEFPELEKADSIRFLLQKKLSRKNVLQEVAYFNRKYNKSYERTYGWAWLLKLHTELHTWNTPFARKLEQNLKPLTDNIRDKYMAYLPKLKYPIRVGTHSNTAFGLSFAYDYATAMQDSLFEKSIRQKAMQFYIDDKSCPINWEPGGQDFLSPCLEEIDIMRRVLDRTAFMRWIHQFLPELTQKDFRLEVGEVTDRTDGYLVHLDGLNFSRAWCLYDLANQYPKTFKHLVTTANKHVAYSLPNLVGDDYMGGHWLASFAIYSMKPLENN